LELKNQTSSQEQRDKTGPFILDTNTCNIYLSKLIVTQEEKLEPLKNINDDPTIRLLNRLYAKKRKELQERQKLKVFMAESMQRVQ